MTLLMLCVSPAGPQDNHAGVLTEVHPVHHQREEIETAATSVSRATGGGSSCRSTTSAPEARNRSSLASKDAWWRPESML